MAQLIGEVLFTGSLENLSAYKMRGTDKIVLRRKGGPTRKQVKHSPKFVNTRQNNAEFGGRAKAAQHIKRILYPLMFLADYNITGPLNALLQPIQKLDTENQRGQRHIQLSKEPRLLEGFTLNRKYLLDSIVRTPVSYTIHEQKEEATVDIPALIPGINFMVPGNYAWYQFIAIMGQVPDLFFIRDSYQTKNKRGVGDFYTKIESTDWLPVNTPAPARKLELKGSPQRKPEACSNLVALGIAFGTIRNNNIEPVKYIGAAKILGVK